MYGYAQLTTAGYYKLDHHGIGVASYGALGHVPPSIQPFNFSGHFIQSRTNSDVRLHVVAY